MKKKCYLLLLIFALCTPIGFIAQTNPTASRAYQKLVKFSVDLKNNEAIEQFKSKFGLDDKSTFVAYQTNKDRSGVIHTRFQQYYRGIKVEYGTLIVHSKDGFVNSINGELYNPNELDLTASISSTTALEKAIIHVGAKSYLWSDDAAAERMQYEKPKGELVIFPVLKNGGSTLTLAYKLDIYATNPLSRGYLFINALNGDFLFNEPIIKHCNYDIEADYGNYSTSSKLDNIEYSITVSGTADTRYSGNRIIETREENDGTFSLNDDSRNVHTYNAQNSPTNGTYQFTSVDFVDDDNVWTTAEYDNEARDNAALDAHWGAMRVYDFWELLGRNSINNMGMELRSYVHVGTDYFNAFWNGSVMSYGDGNPNPLTSLDIISHEMAHGVTTWTANLVYARESGAMNEGFSDIFGAAVEFFARGSGNDTNPDEEVWLLAEDFWPSGYLRSMSDPKSKGDPDTYNGANYTDATATCIPSNQNDYCGVHSNSGVLNHWFYILVTGKAGTNDAGDVYDVTGIGMTKAQEIAYLTLRDYLSANSTFIDARNAAVEVASSLYGSNSTERKATQDAFFAVNLGEEFIPFETDLKLVAFADLIDISCGGAIIPKILVRNSGVTNSISTIQVKYSIDGIQQTPFNWNGILAVDEETEIALPEINESTVKTYNLAIETLVTEDGNASNNVLTGSFRVNRSDTTPSEVNSFEDFLNDYWLTYNEGGGTNLWTVGRPNKATLNSVSSGDVAYITATSEDYPNDTKAFLISPCYDLTALPDPMIMFKMAFELEENFDIVYMEYSKDAINWEVLGSAEDPNWYNSDRIFESGEISEDCQNCPGAQWTGASNGFAEYSYDVSAFASETKMIFRFVFHSNATGTDEGVVIDDFVIVDGSLMEDDDNDGVINSLDVCQNTPVGEIVNEDGCAQSQLDDDDDGVMNDVDLCANTSIGSSVDASGCFTLPVDNFTIEVVGETCPNKDNGILSISAIETYNYIVSIDGVETGGSAPISISDKNFTTNLVLENLKSGNYTICISVMGETFEQCFNLVVEEGTMISGKSTVTKNKTSVEIEIETGTGPFIILVNGTEIFRTNSKMFNVDVSHGDLLEVKSVNSCEGVISKPIELFDEVIAYPNPTDGIFELAIPDSRNEVKIDIYSSSSQLVSVKTYPVLFGKVQLNISDKPTGLYTTKVYLDKPIFLKILKK